jgi:hypothetical protein
MPKAELISAAEFARRQNISAEMVRKAKRQGVFEGALVNVPGRKKPLLKYKLAVRFYNSRLDPNFRKAKQTPQKKAKGGNGKPKAEGDQTFISARAKVEKYKARELKLKHEINAGLWIKKTEVADNAFRAARLARDGFQTIPARVSALVAAETSANRCFAIINKEIKQVLDDFVDQLKRLSKGGLYCFFRGSVYKNRAGGAKGAYV